MPGEESVPLVTGQRKPFAAFLQEHRNGGLHAELSDGLALLVAACREHAKGGSLTLSVKVTPNADGMTMTVSDEVKVKAPEASRGAALWFADEDGNLSRRNPLQPELPLREVGMRDEATRVVDRAEEAGS